MVTIPYLGQTKLCLGLPHFFAFAPSFILADNRIFGLKYYLPILLIYAVIMEGL